MLFILIPLYVVVSIGLLAVSVVRNSRGAVIALNVWWWLMAGVAAVFTGWAFAERAYSENWALIGFLFFSLPVIISTAVLAIGTIVAARIKRLDQLRRAELSLILLLGFLFIQSILGYFAG